MRADLLTRLPCPSRCPANRPRRPRPLAPAPAPRASSHIILLLVSLLTANVYSPDFPLTAIPQEYRELIKLALVITYAINTLVAGYAGFEAKARGLSVPFWVGKCFVLGGVALSELTSISRSKGDERN